MPRSQTNRRRPARSKRGFFEPLEAALRRPKKAAGQTVFEFIFDEEVESNDKRIGIQQSGPVPFPRDGEGFPTRKDNDARSADQDAD